MKSDLDKSTENDAAGGKTGLWDHPNKFARAPGIEVGKGITIHGYQEFQIRDGEVSPLSLDAPLRHKQQLVAPYFSPEFLRGKTLLDIGANGGFFSFSACQAGASHVVALDMDEDYLGLIRQAQTHLGWKQVQPVNRRVQDWEEPADVVLAFAMIHWLYSCTANFGSLEAVAANLAGLTRELLLIEWVAPEDSAITFFKHTDWNPDQVKGPYNLEAFEAALRQHFSKVAILGDTSPTRTLYAVWKQQNEVTLHDALPLLAPVERVLASRLLTSFAGTTFYSRIYTTETPDRLIKQATGDMALHEAELLGQLEGPHFPRVFSSQQHEGYSSLILERIAGRNLSEAIPELAVEPERLASFMSECLTILKELAAAGIEHRDIRMDNLLVRQGRPVLIDFGWSQAAGKPYAAPRNVGALERIPSGLPCDVYSMGKVFEQIIPKGSDVFAPLLQLMLRPSLARRLPLTVLTEVLNALDPKKTWDVPLVWPVPRFPQLVEEPPVKPPFLKRTWRRWKRSIQKRLGLPLSP
jgi:tRNA A-37 threonylcarbamoyl transferase component Bud32